MDKQTISLCTGLAMSIFVASSVRAETLDLHRGTTVRFASKPEAVGILTAHDRFIDALSAFDRQSRLGTTSDVATETFLTFVGKQATEWDSTDSVRIAKLIASIRSRLQPYTLPFPAEILLIRTSGLEEGKAAYCRRNTIILPPQVIARSDDGLERLLVHELFHILSSHSTQLRSQLYKVIGFKRCAPVELPQNLHNLKITNPDGPLADAYIRVAVDGGTRPVIPVLFASANFDPNRGRSFFDYLTFRLMVVEQLEDRWVPAQQDSKPILLDPSQIDSFHQQIGQNTNYILHPDEVLADNFVHLVFETPDLPTPQLIAAMRDIITE